MKRTLLVGALCGLLVVGAAAEMLQATGSPQAPAQGAVTPQPASSGPEAAPPVPAGDQVLGSVRIPRKVMANGQPLDPGTYQVRLTAEEANPPAKGATPTYERWVEFVKGKDSKGREVASLVPQEDLPKVADGARPGPGKARVEMLKGNDYLRVWINKGGANYLIHLVPAA